MNLKALVIDDSKVMRSMVMKALNQTGLAEWTFVEAEDGADGFNKLDPNEIDIAFVDWNMPNMTGIEFVKKVRDRGDADDIPLIMVTSEKTVSKIEEALDEAGANAFISKPFTPDELRHKLQKVFDAMEEAEAAAAAPKKSGWF
jgi:two-component system chemotaxis response regulator CheY